MPYALLADALLVAHALFVLWVVVGAWVVLHRPRWAGLHLPAAAWGVWIEWSGGLCPLTPWEWRLRELAGQAAPSAERGFIEHYLTAVLYPAGLTREVQWALGAAVLIVNLGVYAWALWRWRARARRIA